MFENLKEYFKNTPKEQIQKDWDESEPFDKVGPTVIEFFNNQKRYSLDAYSYNDLRNMLNDVCNELDLSDDMLEKHGPVGTPVSELVRLVLDQKDLENSALKNGLKLIDPGVLTKKEPKPNSSISDELIDTIIEELVQWNHHDDKERKQIREIEKRYGVDYISVDVEKHNQLQYTYYFEIDFDTVDIYYIEIENGINNGTQINSQGWGTGTKPESRTVEVLKDVVFSEEKFKKWCLDKKLKSDVISFFHRQATNMLENKKDFIKEIHRKQNYDNYVTGGGTHKTDKAYNDWYQEFNDKGCFWEFVYEEIEVDPNFQ